MKNITNILITLLFITITCISLGCSNKKSNVDQHIDPEETINSSLDNLIELLWLYREGSFTNRTISFLGANSGEYLSSDWVEILIDKLDEHIQHSNINNNKRFNFNQHRGTYTWNSNQGRWVKSSNNMAIILRFPSAKNQSVNSMELHITEYTDTPVLIDGETNYLPSKARASLRHNNNEIFNMQLDNLIYVSHKYVFLPANGTLTLRMNNFVQEFTFSQNNSRHFKFEHTLRSDDKLAFGFSLNLDLRHSSYSDLSEDDFVRLYGAVNITDLVRVEADIAIGELLIRDSLTENEINDFVGLDVYSNNNKIAEMKYHDSLDNYRVIYPDGSGRDIDFFAERFLQQLESVFYIFTGNWYDW